MRETFSIVEPLYIEEATVLRAHALGLPVDEGTPAARVAWATTTQRLTKRGLLAKTSRGIVVTPEGLAALLDAVPVELMRTGSRPAAAEGAAAGAATSPSMRA